MLHNLQKLFLFICHWASGSSDLLPSFLTISQLITQTLDLFRGQLITCVGNTYKTKVKEQSKKATRLIKTVCVTYQRQNKFKHLYRKWHPSFNRFLIFLCGLRKPCIWYNSHSEEHFTKRYFLFVFFCLWNCLWTCLSRRNFLNCK